MNVDLSVTKINATCWILRMPVICRVKNKDLQVCLLYTCILAFLGPGTMKLAPLVWEAGPQSLEGCGFQGSPYSGFHSPR